MLGEVLETVLPCLEFAHCIGWSVTACSVVVRTCSRGRQKCYPMAIKCGQC